MAVSGKCSLSAGVAPPPGAGSTAPCPCRLFLCHPVQALPSGVDGKKSAGLHHAGRTLAACTGPHRPSDDPLRVRPCRRTGPGACAGAGTAESRNFIDLRKIQPVRRYCAPESSPASASGRPAGKTCHQSHAHPDDQNGPRDRGALKLRGCCGRRTGGGQAQGPHHPEAGCRAGQSLHRKLLRPLPLPAGTAAQG